jgi:cytochrome bd-type quinol oxidase subunit 1
MAIKLPSWLPYDKFKHIVAGLMIFGFTSLTINLVLGLIITLAVGIGKELIDVFYIIPNGTIYKPWKWVKKFVPEWDKFDVVDFVATVFIPILIFSFIQMFS